MARRMFVLALGALGIVAPARATVSPPIKITLSTNKAAAVNGREFSGAFEIHVGKVGALDNVRLLGDGWASVEIVSPPRGTAVQPGVLRIPFRAVPQDADKRIGLSVTWNGREVTKHFKVGPAAMAQLGRPYPGGRLEAGPAGAPGGRAVQKRAGHDGSSTGQGRATDLRVTGRIVYTRSDSLVVGADAIWVQVMDEDDVVVDDVIWEGLTYADGSFDTGWVSIDDSGGPDVYVRWECDTGVVNVQDGYSIDEEDYSWSTEDTILYEDFGGGELDFGSLTSVDPSLMPAMHIHNSIVRTHRFILTQAGFNVPEVDAQWPEDSTEYSCTFDEIYVSVGRQWNESSHAHEYGHHFECNFSDLDTPDYCNGVCDTAQDCGHCLWCDENLTDAWHEGFANWVGDVVTRSFPLDYTTLDGCPYQPLFFRNLEAPQMCGCCAGCSCPYPSPVFTGALITEGFVGAFLTDIEDDNQDDHNGDGIFDCMALGPAPIFQAVDAFEFDSVLEFVDGFTLLNPTQIDKLKQTAENVAPGYASGFPADTAAPGVVTTVWSPTHPLGVGGPLPCITAMWEPADDDVSGAAAYSYIWSDTADPGLVPDQVEEVSARCIATAPGPAIMPGEHLFLRIRARDDVGNWGAASQWFGPFVVTTDECSQWTNGIPDVCDAYCDLADAPIMCAGPVPEFCTSFATCGTALDCNDNASPDDCDIADGVSNDCAGDGIPDECQAMRYWIDGTGSWHAPTNWDLSAPPVANPCVTPPPPSNPGTPTSVDDVCIDVASDATVTYSTGASTINSLSCRDNLTLTDGSLTISTDSFVEGDLEVSYRGAFEVPASRSLDVFGKLWMHGTSSVGNAGTLRGAGTTRTWGQTEISQVPILEDGHLIENYGAATFTDGLDLRGGSQYINRLSGHIDKQTGYFYVFTPSAGTFLNEGTFVKTGSDPSEIAVPLVNTGLIHIQFGELSINPALSAGSSTSGAILGNAGTWLYIKGGNHQFDTDSTIVADNVSFQNQSIGSIEVEGTYNVATSTTIDTNQPVTFATGANVVSYGDTVNVEGVAFFNAVASEPIVIDTLNVTAGTAWFNSGDPVNVGILNISTGTLRGPSPVNVSGLLTWSAAGHFFDPGVVNANGGLLTPAGGGVRSLYQRTFNNTGLATMLGAIECRDNSVFNNLATGVVDIQKGSTVFSLNAPANARPVIHNAGVWRKTAPTGASWIYVDFVNSGTVDVQVGELRFQNADYIQTNGATLLTGGDIRAVTQGGSATGTLDLRAGLLRGNGTVFAHVDSTAATVAPGLSAGMLDVMGNYDQNSNGALEIELGGTAQGANYDWLNLSGTATLAGTLQVKLISGFQPLIGTQFEILTAGFVVGTFDTVQSQPGLEVSVIYNPAAVIVEVTDTSTPGDCDDDGDVDLSDFADFELCLDGPAAGLGGGCSCFDFDLDLDIDLVDFAGFQKHFTQ